VPTVCPFRRYFPHRYSLSLFLEGAPAGRTRQRVAVDSTSRAPLFKFCKALCANGGSWLPAPGPVAGCKLVAVEAIIHSGGDYSTFEARWERLGARRRKGGACFNVDTTSFCAQEQLVLSAPGSFMSELQARLIMHREHFIRSVGLATRTLIVCAQPTRAPRKQLMVDVLAQDVILR
jgi:hypothetical protein